jgi:hypothetical protein
MGCTGGVVRTTYRPRSPHRRGRAEPGTATNDGCDSTPNFFTTIAAPSFPATTLSVARAAWDRAEPRYRLFRFQATSTTP